MENLANEIQKRANDLDVSISELCKRSGVSRGWFEKLKHRTPVSIEIYLKIEQQLVLMEQNKLDYEHK